MGIIRRQGIKHSIISYLAAVLGIINVLFIQTYALKPEEIGLYSYIISLVAIVSPFVLLGSSLISVKYFSIFENKENNHNGFFLFVVFFPIIPIALLWLTNLIFDYDLNSALNQKSLEFNLFFMIMLFLIPLVFQRILKAYISNFGRVVVPEILTEFLTKLTFPILAIIYFYTTLNFVQLLYLLAAIQYLSLIGIFIYGYINGFVNFTQFPSKKVLLKHKKEILNYGLYGVLASIGTLLATRVDIIMTGSLINLKEAGIYTIASSMAMMLNIPMKSLMSISGPLIAQKLNNGDIVGVEEIYKKSSDNLFLAASFLFVLLIGNIDSIFAILPNGNQYLSGISIIVVIGFSRLIDLASGINNHIIGYSKYYKFNLVLVLVLAVVNTGLNLLLIPYMGKLGAAISTLISIFLHNMLKFIFILRKFNIQPFTYNSIKVLIFGLVLFLIIYQLPNVNNMPWINLFYKSSICVLLSFIILLKFNLSEDGSALIKEHLKKRGIKWFN